MAVDGVLEFNDGSKHSRPGANLVMQSCHGRSFLTQLTDVTELSWKRLHYRL